MRCIKRKLFVWLLALITNKSGAQDSTKFPRLFKTVTSTDLLVGMNWQGSTKAEKTYRFYEIGLAKGRYLYHPHGVTGGAIYISEEVHLNDSGNIYGTKVGVWTHYLFDLGLAAVYYTNFKKGNLKIRPEFGCGMGRLRIVVGYNIPTINNKAFELLKRNDMQISIQFTVGLKKEETPDLVPFLKKRRKQDEYN